MGRGQGPEQPGRSGRIWGPLCSPLTTSQKTPWPIPQHQSSEGTGLAPPEPSGGQGEPQALAWYSGQASQVRGKSAARLPSASSLLWL